MNPEDMKAQMAFQARQAAIQLADKRSAPDASVEEVLVEANMVLQFLQAGANVATPDQDDGATQ